MIILGRETVVRSPTMVLASPSVQTARSRPTHGRLGPRAAPFFKLPILAEESVPGTLAAFTIRLSVLAWGRASFAELGPVAISKVPGRAPGQFLDRRECR